MKKGSLAGVDGRIQTRNYEGQDGKRVYVTEVVAESVQFLEPKGSNSGGRNDFGGGGFGGGPQNSPYGNNDQNQQQMPNRNNQGRTRLDEDPFANDGQIDISDDDLPF